MCLSPILAYDSMGVLVSADCGYCYECLRHKALEWTGRLLMEFVTAQKATFVTLTYDDEHLPDTGVSRRDLQLFMKRIRQSWHSPIRFFAVGEYGGKFCRPHYHLQLFGVDVFEAEGRLWSDVAPNFNGSLRCNCPAWRNGLVALEEFAPGNAAYIAGYVKSKLDVQKRILAEAGRNPTFNQMSNRPGLGYDYMVEHRNEILDKQVICLGGNDYPVPEYFKYTVCPDYVRVARTNALAKQKEQNILDLEAVGGDRSRVYRLQKDRLLVKASKANFMEVAKQCSGS